MYRHNYALSFLIAWLISIPAAVDAQSAPDIATRASLNQNYGWVMQIPATTPVQGQTLLIQADDGRTRTRMMEGRRRAAPAADSRNADPPQSGALSDWISKMELGLERGYQRLVAIAGNIKHVPADMLQALRRLAGGKGYPHLLWIGLLLAGVLVISMGIETLFRRLTSNLYKQIESMPPVQGLFKFWSGLLTLIFELIGMMIFTLSSVILYVLVFGVGQRNARMILIALLLIVLISRVMAALSNLICSPAAAKLRLIPLGDAAAAYLHRNMIRLVRYAAFGYVFCLFFLRLGISNQSFVFLALVLGTILLLAVAVMVWKNRDSVGQAIISGGISADQGGAWLKKQFAGIWHVLALFYLLLVWLMWLSQFVFFQTRSRGVLFISLFAVPIYLVLDRIGQWVVSATIGAADRFKRQVEAQSSPPPAAAALDPEPAAPVEGLKAEADVEARYVVVSRRIMRGFIFLGLLLVLGVIMLLIFKINQA